MRLRRWKPDESEDERRTWSQRLERLERTTHTHRVYWRIAGLGGGLVLAVLVAVMSQAIIKFFRLF